MARTYVNGFGETAVTADEFDLYGAEERDRLIEMVEFAERGAMTELLAYGCIEQLPQFNWSAKSGPEERGWSRAVLDIIECEGAEDAEALFWLM